MWSWVLAAIGVSGIFLVGRKTIYGWLILCLNECLWTIYAVQTHQYVLFLCLLHILRYILNHLFTGAEMNWKE